MKKRIRLFCIIIFICTSFTGIAYAATKYTTIQVQVNPSKIYINGENTDLENFLYDNKIYVPLDKTVTYFNKKVDIEDNKISIFDKDEKTGDNYTHCDSLKSMFSTNVINGTLYLEFQLKNVKGKAITISLENPYVDYSFYDENERLVYQYSKEFGDYAPSIQDKTIKSSKKYTINYNSNLTDKGLKTDQLYKVVFSTTFEIKSEKKTYTINEEAYFQLTK